MLKFRNAVRAFVAMALISVSSPASATEILFALVGGTTTTYSNSGYELSGFVGNLPGMNVRTLHIDPNQGFIETNGALAAPIDWNNLDQVWVYDSSSQADNSTAQMQAYNSIVQWYQNKGNPDIIADGRIMGSSSRWLNQSTGTGVSEEAYIQNYATQLDLHGGGLVLGTDHANAFTRGINEINQGIGIHQFTSFHHASPYRAAVDPNSALFVDSLTSCGLGFAPDDQCISDNTSASDAPYNVQPNGMLLYPTAWHNGNITRVAVSTTMAERLEAPTPMPEPAAALLFFAGLAGLAVARRKRTARN